MIAHKPLFSFQFSVFSFQFSVFSFQFSVFSSQFSVIRYSQTFSPQDTRRAQRSTQAFLQTSSKLHLKEAFHLPPKTFAVAVPPDFLHCGCEIAIHVLQPDHFFQSEASVSAAYA